MTSKLKRIESLEQELKQLREYIYSLNGVVAAITTALENLNIKVTFSRYANENKKKGYEVIDVSDEFVIMRKSTLKRKQEKHEPST